MGKKSSVSSPLILLQQLSRSLLSHFEAACEQALADTQKALATLEKQRGKLEQSLRDLVVELEAAGSAGKTKAQARARKGVDALQSALDELVDRQVQTRAYLVHLQRDVQASLGLSRGIGSVADAAGKALDQITLHAKPAVARRAASVAKKSAAKPAVASSVSAKPAQAKPAAVKKVAVKPAQAKPAPVKTSSAKPAAVKPAASKPAVKKSAQSKAVPSASSASKPALSKTKPASAKPQATKTPAAKPVTPARAKRPATATAAKKATPSSGSPSTNA